MISEQTQSIAVRAKAIYAERLQARLETENQNRFVAIEPESGDCFISDSFGQAVADARLVYPDRISLPSDEHSAFNSRADVTTFPETL